MQWEIYSVERDQVEGKYGRKYIHSLQVAITTPKEGYPYIKISPYR